MSESDIVCYVLQETIYHTYISSTGFLYRFDHQKVGRFPDLEQAKIAAKPFGNNIRIIPCEIRDRRTLLKSSSS